MTHLNIAKTVIEKEAKALEHLANNLPADFEPLVNHILALKKGRVILVGMGKSGYIAKKIAASLASTGTPSFYVHPSEASHGDLGMITVDDLVIMLSNSGETQELFDTINYCKKYKISMSSITMNEKSTLAINSNFLLLLPKQPEASALPAPTTSAIMTLSIGDALVTALHKAREFMPNDFKIFHPGGKIGSSLLKVEDIMHKGDSLPIAKFNDSFINTIVIMNKKRLGCAIILDDNNQMSGIITDGDLRRHINDNLDSLKAEDVMTPDPLSIDSNALATEALSIMRTKIITSLPVIDNNKLIGVIHIHDILKVGVE
ncbi:MAG: KpsF/GutQ family sugar-phosphate isomerase [Rickettsiaceae bacterium]|nr:KpsF/GutQ family sugar-phosphate isomerase [Rickettsiaceae bacterium]